MDPNATSFTPTTPLSVAVGQGSQGLPFHAQWGGFNPRGFDYRGYYYHGYHYRDFAFACHHIDLPIRNQLPLPVQKRRSRFFPIQREPTPPTSDTDAKAQCVPSDHQLHEHALSPALSNLDGYPRLQRTISPFALPSPLSLPSPVIPSPQEISNPTFSCTSTLVEASSSASGSDL